MHLDKICTLLKITRLLRAGLFLLTLLRALAGKSDMYYIALLFYAISDSAIITFKIGLNGKSIAIIEL